MVWLVLAVACVPLVAGFLLAYPRALPAAPGSKRLSTERRVVTIRPAQPGSLVAALREPGVLLGALLLVYVGLEIGVGNWGFSYLVQARGLSRTLAGYSVSGFWLGLTAGRFLISPVADRVGLSTGRHDVRVPRRDHRHRDARLAVADRRGRQRGAARCSASSSDRSSRPPWRSCRS